MVVVLNLFFLPLIGSLSPKLHFSLPPAQPAQSSPSPPTSQVRGRNCIIEVSGAGRSDSVSYYSSSLNVQISEAYGQLKVTDADTGAPLRCVYVKVYAQVAILFSLASPWGVDGVNGGR